MRYLNLFEILERHRRIIKQSGGAEGVRDLGALKSALAQPYMTFAGEELYPTLAEKASSLGFSLIQNHPFVDGNKRIAHAALEIFLMFNGYEIKATVDEQEKIILQVASSEISRVEFTDWLRNHIIKWEIG
ncbi:MAG: type II toxin-antitoxin system death-on-curing family toxin [Chloroflexi bacterium]|nr:type II toxin-antitoxin system death-on-curing family toxin [Chloroflexota bacterium]